MAAQAKAAHVTGITAGSPRAREKSADLQPQSSSYYSSASSQSKHADRGEARFLWYPLSLLL
jgi:hypothetical protein